MTIHHFNILGCPFCGHLYRSPVFGSYNTFSAIYWSDGEVTNGIPQKYPLLKCHSAECGGIFFVEEVISVGETINTDNLRLPREILEECPPNPPEWENATHIHYARPNFIELCGFLNSQRKFTSIQVKILLKEIINKYNDNYRENAKWEPTEEEYAKMREKLHLLIDILENSKEEGDLLSVAEYYRELGEFEQSLAILKNVKSEKLKEFKEKIFSLAKQHVTRLVNLNTIAIRKEYCCNHCKKSVFVFDLEKLESRLTYGVIYCSSCNQISNTNLTIANPINYYSRNLLQKLFVKYKPIVPVREPTCGLCDSKEVTLFDIQHEKCPFCHTGIFEWVEWEW